MTSWSTNNAILTPILPSQARIRTFVSFKNVAEVSSGSSPTLVRWKLTPKTLVVTRLRPRFVAVWLSPNTVSQFVGIPQRMTQTHQFWASTVAKECMKSWVCRTCTNCTLEWLSPRNRRSFCLSADYRLSLARFLALGQIGKYLACVRGSSRRSACSFGLLC